MKKGMGGSGSKNDPDRRLSRLEAERGVGRTWWWYRWELIQSMGSPCTAAAPQ